MKILSIWLMVVGLIFVAMFFGELFNIMIPFLDWKSIFMVWAGYIAFMLINNKNI